MLCINIEVSIFLTEHEDRKSKIYGHTTNKKESYEIVEMLPAEETNIGKKF